MLVHITKKGGKRGNKIKIDSMTNYIAKEIKIKIRDK
mgnify:CR=1 FL=1